MAINRLLRLIGLAFILPTALAFNDWSKPCFDGECAYDLPQTDQTVGFFTLFAPPQVLTDITPAAGWIILDCDPNTLEQDIRLVCETNHGQPGCQNLFDHAGPINKVVRLPESCGHGPFARIANMSVAEDQTLPSHVEGKIRRRDGKSPEVHVLGIDGNFAALDKPGDVNFAFVGAIGAGSFEAISDTASKKFNSGAPVKQRLQHKYGRMKSSSSLSEWFKGAIKTIGGAISNAGKWIGDKLEDLTGYLKDKTTVTFAPELKEVTIPINAPPVKFNKSHEWPKCHATTTLEFNVELKTGGSITIHAGLVITGSILGIDHVEAFGALDGDIHAYMTATLKLSGGFANEHPLITDYGIPGFSIPKILTVGPYISLHGKIAGQLDINLETSLHLSYNFHDIQMWYSNSGSAEKPFAKKPRISSGQSDFGVAAAAEGHAKGFIKTSLTPSVNFGIAVGGKVAEANVHLGAEIWARALIAIDAHASVSNAAGKKHLQTRKMASREVSAGFSGCCWIDAGFQLYGSGKGQIWKWKVEAPRFNIYKSDVFDIYSKCWAVGKSTAPQAKPSWAKDELTHTKKGASCTKSLRIPSQVKDKIPAKDLTKKG